MSFRRTPGPIHSVVVVRKVSATRGNNSPDHNHGGYGSRRSPGRREELKLLPRRRLALALALALALPILFVGAVAAVGAAGDGAEYAVMAGIVAGDAADRGAFQAAFGG